MPENSTTFVTKGGITIEVLKEHVPLDSALSPILDNIDTRKGAVFSSGFDYPGRHSRWDIGFIDPALEFVSTARRFSFSALNPQGEALLPLIVAALKKNSHVKELRDEKQTVAGELHTPPKFLAEELRSKQSSVFSVLRTVVDLFKSPDAEHLGFYGAMGFDLVQQFEDLKLRLTRDSKQSDCHLFLPLQLVVVDRKKEVATRVSYSVHTSRGKTQSLPAGGTSFALAAPTGTNEITCDHKPGEFAGKVKKIIDGTLRGDYFEVVLSQQFSARAEAKPSDLFSTLQRINPSPYLFLMNLGAEQLVGSSPEIYIRVTGRRYETCPISGTIARGKTALEDADNVKALLNSGKEESELTMCTDVDRNDMARVCVPGTVRIIGRRQLEFYSHLIHTVDHVEGTLADGFDALDAFQTHMWACTVSGSPKPAALQAIEDLENSPRGWYSGAIGMISFTGDINTGITLRTVHVKNGRATIRAGATLLYGSNPESEEQETKTKAAASLHAMFAQSEPLKVTATIVQPTVIAENRKRVLLVDHRDSFVHNLAAYLRQGGANVTTLRSGFPLAMLDDIEPQLVVLSPGPGSPEEFGVPNLVGILADKKIPTFGVCLGHQGIGQHFGAKLAQLPTPEHGKIARITHNGDGLFEDIPQEFEAGRYHSLYVREETLPDCLEVLAHNISTSTPRVPMALRHKTLPIACVQFHPESLMTLKGNVGHILLRNALKILTTR